MVVGLNSFNFNSCVLMVSEDLVLVENKFGLDYREVYQVIREFIYGIYVLNQIFSIFLEVLYDQGIWCNLFSGFNDIYIGLYCWNFYLELFCVFIFKGGVYLQIKRILLLELLNDFWEKLYLQNYQVFIF